MCFLDLSCVLQGVGRMSFDGILHPCASLSSYLYASEVDYCQAGQSTQPCVHQKICLGRGGGGSLELRHFSCCRFQEVGSNSGMLFPGASEGWEGVSHVLQCNLWQASSHFLMQAGVTGRSEKLLVQDRSCLGMSTGSLNLGVDPAAAAAAAALVVCLLLVTQEELCTFRGV